MTHIKVKTPVYVPSFFNLMDKFMNDELNAVSAKQPAVNIIEKDQQYELVMMAPGLSKSDFTISLEKEYLTISYTKSATNEEETPKFIKKEFSQESFKRTFTLNENLNGDDITAKYENGLLTVIIPKLVKEETPNKTIEIN